jgi:hypothetical protein
MSHCRAWGRRSIPPPHSTSCRKTEPILAFAMHTPHHISVENFAAEEALFLATACLEYPDKVMSCAQCGTQIKWEMAFISTHCQTELCIGTGAITPVDIPYCPQCEEIPYERGCFHVTNGQSVAAQLAESNLIIRRGIKQPIKAVQFWTANPSGLRRHHYERWRSMRLHLLWRNPNRRSGLAHCPAVSFTNTILRFRR